MQKESSVVSAPGTHRAHTGTALHDVYGVYGRMVDTHRLG